MCGPRPRVVAPLLFLLAALAAVGGFAQSPPAVGIGAETPVGQDAPSFHAGDPAPDPEEESGPCEASDTVLCLRDGRFAVSIQWNDGASLAGHAQVADPHTEDSGLFWFFGRDNWELMIKVLDGCDFNGYYWVFFSASTNMGYRVEVADLEADVTVEYNHEAGSSADATNDIEAFATCSSGT